MTNTPTWQDSTAGDQPGAPTRQQVDELASRRPSSETGWDGQPLDDAGRRLYGLRDSGYNGPIDQDGYPATTGDAADTLRRMAQRRGETVDW